MKVGAPHAAAHCLSSAVSPIPRRIPISEPDEGKVAIRARPRRFGYAHTVSRKRHHRPLFQTSAAALTISRRAVPTAPASNPPLN